MPAAPAPLTTLEEHDLRLGAAVARRKHHPAVQRLAKLGALGDQEPLYATALLLMAASQVRPNRYLARASLSMLFAVGAADLIKTLLKLGTHRSRPDRYLKDGHYSRGAGRGAGKAEESFPSGHMACTVAASLAMRRYYPQLAPGLTIGAATIGLARTAAGAHWPLDVAAGAVIGWLAEGLGRAVAYGFGIRRRKPRSR